MAVVSPGTSWAAPQEYSAGTLGALGLGKTRVALAGSLDMDCNYTGHASHPDG